MLSILPKTSRKMNATYRSYLDIWNKLFGINNIYEMTFYILSGCKYIFCYVPNDNTIGAL